MSINNSHQNPSVIYIVGRGHSGSTMLELLLNRNPHATSMGEVNLLGLQLFRSGNHTRWIGTCSCKERPFACPIWGRVLNEIQNDYRLNLEANPMSYRISDEGMAEEYGWKKPIHSVIFRLTRLARLLSHKKLLLLSVSLSTLFRNWSRKRDSLYRAFAKVQEAGTVVDASKDYLQMLDIYKYSKLPVKILYITRDVRGHAWSSIRKKGYTATKEAKVWTKLNKRIIKALDQIRQQDWMHIRYEDLCSDTNLTLSKIFEFAGLPDRQLSPEDERKRRHTIAGNQTRFRDLTEIRHDQKWHDNLDSNDLDSIRKHACKTSNKLGYKLDANSDI